jgi:hypothetical protein
MDKGVFERRCEEMRRRNAAAALGLIPWRTASVTPDSKGGCRAAAHECLTGPGATLPIPGVLVIAEVRPGA